MPEKLLRFQGFVSKNPTVIVAILLIAGVTGGWLTATAYLAPGTTTTEKSVTAWESTGELTHQATVTEPNPVYDTGTTLTNRSSYFTTITPHLDGNYTFTYTAREGGKLSGRITVVAVLRSVTGDEQRSSTLWETTHELNSTNVSAVEPGERVRVPFSVNMAALQNQSTDVQETLGTTRGQIQVELLATVTYEGTLNGRSVTDQIQHALPMRYQGNLYQVENPGPKTDEYATTQRVQVAKAYGPLHRLGGPLLLLLSLAGLGVLGTAHLRDELDVTPHERETLAYHDDRADYEEWITAINLPDAVFERPCAEADSLGDLVNFAIDTDNAVIEEPSRGIYVVVHEDCCYTFTPPSTPREASGTVSKMETSDTTPEEVDASIGEEHTVRKSS